MKKTVISVCENYIIKFAKINFDSFISINLFSILQQYSQYGKASQMEKK
jgi:hypothetical protein